MKIKYALLLMLFWTQISSGSKLGDFFEIIDITSESIFNKSTEQIQPQNTERQNHKGRIPIKSDRSIQLYCYGQIINDKCTGYIGN